MKLPFFGDERFIFQGFQVTGKLSKIVIEWSKLIRRFFWCFRRVESKQILASSASPEKECSVKTELFDRFSRPYNPRGKGRFGGGSS